MKFALIFSVTMALSAEASVGALAWGKSPEAYFMTPEEQREWALVTSDADAERFVAAFRARRAPDFAEDVARRVAIVDERLAIGEIRASQTLRGRIAILLGAPAELRSIHIPKPYRGSVGLNKPYPMSRGRPRVTGGADGWMEYTFRYAARPELGIEEGWTVVIEANVISGKDALRHGRERKKLEEILEAAARKSLWQE